MFFLAPAAFSERMHGDLHREHPPAESAASDRGGDPYAVCRGHFAADANRELRAKQMAVVAPMEADHEMRVAHALWHYARQPRDTELHEQIVKYWGKRWRNPHPVCPVKESSRAGEDFLFMHRNMVRQVSETLVAHHLPCIAPWKNLPEKDDPYWPVPREGESGVVSRAKSDKGFQLMKAWEAKFNDPQWLRRHTLGQVGNILEFSLHTNMHARWAAPGRKAGWKSYYEDLINGRLPNPWTCDDPKYDYLGDFYCGHVNEVFWKLHGFVDGIIDSWLRANGYTEIAENCADRPGCYQWQGTWVGDSAMMRHHHSDPANEGEVRAKPRDLADPPRVEDEFDRFRHRRENATLRTLMVKASDPQAGTLTKMFLEQVSSVGGEPQPDDPKTDPEYFVKHQICGEK